MRKRKSRHISISILMIIMCISLIFPMITYAKASDKNQHETIRVGFFAFDGYHMMDEKGNRSGYGYDFLRMAARYLNANYEYIGYDKSWDEMQDMLENGEIDLLTSVQKTSDRMEKFDFSKPIGTSSAILTVKSDNTRIVEQEYTTYENMKVGMLRENSRNDDFAEFAKEKNFTYQTIFYDKESDLKEALQNGEVDTVLTSSLRSIHDERVIEKFATHDFYAAVKKGNTPLLNEINYAIDQMNQAEGDWIDALDYQYYGQTEAKTLVFSEREKEIIQQYASGKEKLTVTCSIDREPYSYVENGKLKGIIPELFEELMDYAGIPYEIVIPKDRKEYEQWEKDGTVDIFMDGRVESENEAEANDVAVTVPYMNFGLARVTRRDFDGKIEKLAVARYQGMNGIEDNLVKDAERIQYDSREEALEAVRDGQADATYVYLYTAQKFVNQDSRGSVTYTVIDHPVYPHRICIMPSASHELSGILTKCIYALPDNKLESLILKYTAYTSENVTILTFIMLHPIKSFVAIALWVVILMCVLVLWTRLHERKKMLVVEKKRAEEKDILAKLAKSASESKSRFLFNMSHDIRTPLNAVLGFTNLAKEAVDDPEKEKDYLEKIQISGEHLLDIINDILEMSRVESSNVKLDEAECNLKEVIRESIVLIEESSKKKEQQFKVDIDGIKHPYVICDSLKLREILVQILENAVKFTSIGGDIQLSIRQLLNDDEEYADLIIGIRDNGCGMSSAFVEKMFLPFEREKTNTVSGLDGTGLGLAIAKSYIDAMGGDIQVQSEVAKGTEITITVQQKLTEKPTKESVEVSKEDFTRKFCGKRILIVEDNDLNREIEVAILEEAGFVVEEAVDGQEAVNKVKDSQGRHYDGILMDIQMPVMDGYEATREIRQLKNPVLSKTPIIAVSANAFDEDKIASEEAGMNAHIAKPIQMDYLFQTLDEILDK